MYMNSTSMCTPQSSVCVASLFQYVHVLANVFAEVMFTDIVVVIVVVVVVVVIVSCWRCVRVMKMC